MSRQRARPPILCVDDEPKVVQGLKTTLGTHYTVSTATSGAEALELMEKSEFPVIMTDMRMPEMDGAALARAIRERAPDTLCIVLTGYAGYDTALAAVNEGHVFAFLSKPASTEALVDVIEAALAEHLRRREQRQTLEVQVHQLASVLANAEKLATLGSIAGAVGHELNNQLMVFSGVLALLQHRCATGQPPAPDELEELTDVLDVLRRHAGQLLHLGKPPDDTAATVELQDVVRRSADMLRLAGFTKTLDVSVSAPHDPVLVNASPGRLEQVFFNLLKNAADAVRGMPRRGRIEIRIATPDAAGMAQCSVEDNGCGIPPEALGEVFEPYYTTKPPGEGTGLGLPVVRQIVEGYGGRVELSSAPGAGCEVRVSLPVLVTPSPCGPAGTPAAASALS